MLEKEGDQDGCPWPFLALLSPRLMQPPWAPGTCLGPRDEDKDEAEVG